MNFERESINVPRPAAEEKVESIESVPNKKTLERITNLRKVYPGLHEALNFELYRLRDRVAVYFTPGNEEKGFADAVNLLTEEQCKRMNEILALFAFNYVEKQTSDEPKDADTFDQMAHADAITSIFKELPSRNENAMRASVGLDPASV